MSRKGKKNQRGRVGKVLVQESLDWSDTGLWTLSGRAGMCSERVRRTTG